MQKSDLINRISFRPAETQDFDYCQRLYFAGMDEIIRALQLNKIAQIANFREQWVQSQVRIIALDAIDVGWLQSAPEADSIFIGQLYLDPAFQGRGIGTEVIKQLIAEATRTGQAMTLGVVKINPAVRLYQRLGFRVTHEDQYKFFMRRTATCDHPPIDR